MAITARNCYVFIGIGVTWSFCSMWIATHTDNIWIQGFMVFVMMIGFFITNVAVKALRRILTLGVWSDKDREALK